MTGFLLGGILVVGLVAVGEGYVIFGRMQLFLTAAEQILGALQVPLREVATKSAPRTIAAADVKPRPWFQTLRRLAELRDHLVDVAGPDDEDEEQLEDEVDDDVDDDQADDEVARWADDGGPEPGQVEHGDPEDDVATDTFPAIDPPTVPAGLAIDVWQHTEIPPRTDLDDVDRRLARFTFAEGHTR